MKKGFTLIELLVVIAIIGILSSIILVNLASSRAKARDAQRVSDIGQIQLALSLYYDRCGQYPPPHSGKIDSTVLAESTGCPSGSGISLQSFISQIPMSPAGGSLSAAPYDYVANSSDSDYVLHSSLEYSSSAQANSFSETSRASAPYSSWATGFSCYDAASHQTEYCVTSR
ncbi:MAG: type II secretion system protein [Patescibacteria group bacterium]|nr:type II secretion system protein [Patescibacteria group bacterium]